MSTEATRIGVLVLLSLVFLGPSGCGGGRQGGEQKVPAVAMARDSLDAALAAWQKGQPRPGKLDSVSPAVRPVDFQWLAGQKLLAYEIGDQIPREGPVWFAVKLTLDAPRRVVDARYAIVGHNPVWVFRDEDYEKITEHVHR